ncbi:family 20 glycosylhydrolase [Pelagicoccus sp. SDUM812003]|uniref:beta-N-acetylhexosaminidase n=1 Tax=Pelagicoccus sp. SDUM812003 TaxID=3041267 RepID=UPI0028100DE1|nr:family 20 glycosylhydrolase [Pelagicoccus sp. SDUM812003]MDQ8203382.1 family 20 glycosylhydrolase [Pelagicoccus sp. SDUM812003]
MILFPPPKKVQLLEGASAFTQNRVRFPHAASPRLKSAVARLGFQPASEGIELNIGSHPPVGYTISANGDSIAIRASDEESAFRAFTTFRQLLRQRDERIPALLIEDSPDLETRGFMLDISRCKVPRKSSLFSLIDKLADLKYNQLQLYTEHTFAYRDHRLVWQDASPLTADEIQEIDSYCYDRYIELVPNQNTFGHMERWLRHKPYQSLAESPNGFLHPLSGWKEHGSTLKPDQASLDFVASLLEELLPNFRSSKVNIGGDEPWELGQGASKTLVNTRGKHAVYLDHLLRIQKLVSKSGRQPQFWGDIVMEKPSLVSELPSGTTALLWGYEANHPFAEQCAIMQQAGLPYYVVPGTSTWNSIGGRLSTALLNIEAATDNALAHGATGLLLTEWGDNGHHQSDLLKIPSALYAAGRAWNKHATHRDHLSTAARLVFSDLTTERDFRDLMELGRIPDHFSQPLHNASWLNKVLFASKKDFQAIRDSISLKEVTACIDNLNTINASHSSLAVSRELLLFAAHKAHSILNNQAPAAIPQELLNRFEEDWLSRNRPGGLAESLTMLATPNS